MHGLIFDIQRASFVDGPGIRTTVFFYGCNLKCKWCHNPEGAFVPITNLPCEYIPKSYSVDELVDIVSEDIPFYKENGGVTCSGGECMLQSDFISKFLRKCKEKNINTCIDTAGNVSFREFEKVLPYTDIFLYDVKCVSPILHRNFTGADNQVILENLQKLYSFSKKIIIRIPVIPEFNGSIEEIRKIKVLLKDMPDIKIELLPYHTLGEGKYDKLNLICNKFTVPNENDMELFRKILNN